MLDHTWRDKVRALGWGGKLDSGLLTPKFTGYIMGRCKPLVNPSEREHYHYLAKNSKLGKCHQGFLSTETLLNIVLRKPNWCSLFGRNLAIACLNLHYSCINSSSIRHQAIPIACIDGRHGSTVWTSKTTEIQWRNSDTDTQWGFLKEKQTRTACGNIES